MDFGFSEEQEMLRSSARQFLAAETPVTLARRVVEQGLPFPHDTWNRMAHLGWMGLALPSEFGGAGLGMVDLVVLLEEMGRCVLPGPYFSTVVLGALPIRMAGNPEQQRRWLPLFAEGTCRATLAHVEESGEWDSAGVQLEARPVAEGFLLSGTKLFVPEAEATDLLLVSTRTTKGRGREGITVFLVEARAAGVGIRPLVSLDATRRLSEVTFDDVVVSRQEALGGIDAGGPMLEGLLDRARVALCAEMCGGMEQVLSMSVEYARTRQQFGRPIGSFQAIQHKCADMLVQLEKARSATYYAAWAIDHAEAEARLAACLAKACVSEAARFVASEAIQVHGGIGFTWEHDLHLFYKRAKASELAFGNADWNRERVARVLLDSPATAKS